MGHQFFRNRRYGADHQIVRMWPFVGAMTLAVMTRASLGHTGRPRHAGSLTVLIYMLVNLGAVVRVFGPMTDLPANLVLGVAAGSWSGAYLLFALVYGPFLLRPSLDE